MEWGRVEEGLRKGWVKVGEDHRHVVATISVLLFVGAGVGGELRLRLRREGSAITRTRAS